MFIVAPTDTANGDYQGCDDRNNLLPFMFWRNPDNDGGHTYHAGWPNDLTPLTEYELRISWNHYSGDAKDAEIWMPFTTTCGCSTADPDGTPVSYRTLETPDRRWCLPIGLRHGFALALNF